MTPAKKHNAWRRRLAKGLPALCARVFALRGVNYMGSGFHYAMERSLGQVIRIASNLDQPFEISDAIIDQVIVEELHRDVARAEQSLQRVALSC